MCMAWHPTCSVSSISTPYALIHGPTMVSRGNCRVFFLVSYYDSRTKRWHHIVPRQQKKSWPSIRQPTARGRPSTSSSRPPPTCADRRRRPRLPPPRHGLHRSARASSAARMAHTGSGRARRREGGRKEASGGLQAREGERGQGRRPAASSRAAAALRPPCGSSTAAAAAPPLLLHLLHCRSAPPLSSRPQQGRPAPARPARLRRRRPARGGALHATPRLQPALHHATASCPQGRSQEFQMRGAKQLFGGGQKLIRGII